MKSVTTFPNPKADEALRILEDSLSYYAPAPVTALKDEGDLKTGAIVPYYAAA